jgi:hypothetical protein
MRPPQLGTISFPVYIFYGPVSTTPATALPFPATPIVWLSASEEPGIEAGTCIVHLSCLPAVDTDYSHGILVLIAGYDGNGADVEIYQDTNVVLTFTLKRTGETPSFSVCAVNAAGAISSASAAVALTLNGTATIPTKLASVVATEGHGLTEVSFQAAPESNVTEYRLYRGAYGGTFSGATLVETIQQTEEANYSMADPGHVNGGVNTYQWYVTSVNPTGESTPSDPVLPFVKW